jgi:hypothetical protein
MALQTSLPFLLSLPGVTRQSIGPRLDGSPRQAGMTTGVSGANREE